ncbi:MAG: hypothetical protein CfP315_0002 [Candidatus Improbicoccus pseudotrichonymphae]|uniref:Uncharacterized protein n=1 Tax=Candidatus Improbicoccus pseudotrichonymphae TaxID=3033792 RepID=A0AA48HUC3_9FIRM|nr:MAG: hypothetical protein CfP315_0002 [Candidatus Improbicoccus pseudotrichonymphae]
MLSVNFFAINEGKVQIGTYVFKEFLQNFTKEFENRLLPKLSSHIKITNTRNKIKPKRKTLEVICSKLQKVTLKKVEEKRDMGDFAIILFHHLSSTPSSFFFSHTF